MKVRLATPADAAALVAHMREHSAESGVDGDPIFHPMPSPDRRNPEEEIKRITASMEKTITDAGWERFWLVEEAEKILGHASLRGGHLPAGMHRCTFAIGLLRIARGQGLGRALTQACIDWAREEKLSWIDLYAFTHNAPALALYRVMGFKEIGTTEDLFRVNGTLIADTHMVLKL